MTDAPIHCSKTEVWPLGKFVPHPRNPNKHPANQIALLGKIITAQGWRSPICVSKRSGFVIKGHGRLAAALAAGLKEAPVDLQDYATEADEWADMIADNRLAELAEIDLPQLKDLLQDLDTGEIDMDLTGFDADALADMMLQEHQEEGDAEPQLDKAAELNKTWKVKAGDLWRIGEHRLLCGDSTNKEDVERVMGGEKAGVCFTSPPYGQQRDYTKESKDKVSDWDALMVGVFGNLPMANNGQVLVNLGLIHRDGEWVPYWDNWIERMRANGWRRFGWYVWDQGFGLPGDWNGRLGPSHEFIFHFNRESIQAGKVIEKKAENIKVRHKGGSTMRGKDGVCRDFSSPEASAQPNKIPDSVIRINRMPGGHDIAHPAIFPPALPQLMISVWDGIAFEPFMGSGTTMVACQNLGRKCRGLEISPDYCAVILQRMADAFPSIKIERDNG